jgi:hypothetical protein
MINAAVLYNRLVACRDQYKRIYVDHRDVIMLTDKDTSRDWYVGAALFRTYDPMAAGTDKILNLNEDQKAMMGYSQLDCELLCQAAGVTWVCTAENRGLRSLILEAVGLSPARREGETNA